MIVAAVVWVPAALLGLANHNDRLRALLAVAVLLAPTVAYTASPRWVRLHVWGPVWGIHTGRRAAPKAITAPKPQLALESAEATR